MDTTIPQPFPTGQPPGPVIGAETSPNPPHTTLSKKRRMKEYFCTFPGCRHNLQSKYNCQAHIWDVHLRPQNPELQAFKNLDAREKRQASLAVEQYLGYTTDPQRKRPPYVETPGETHTSSPSTASPPTSVQPLPVPEAQIPQASAPFPQPPISQPPHESPPTGGMSLHDASYPPTFPSQHLPIDPFQQQTEAQPYIPLQLPVYHDHSQPAFPQQMFQQPTFTITPTTCPLGLAHTSPSTSSKTSTLPSTPPNGPCAIPPSPPFVPSDSLLCTGFERSELFSILNALLPGCIPPLQDVRTLLIAGRLVVDNGVFVRSDRRMKENITPLANTLQRLLNLRPSSFNYINSPSETYGFIAQDVQQTFPSIVSADANGILSVDYIQLIPVIIGALQEIIQTIHNDAPDTSPAHHCVQLCQTTITQSRTFHAAYDWQHHLAERLTPLRAVCFGPQPVVLLLLAALFLLFIGTLTADPFALLSPPMANTLMVFSCLALGHLGASFFFPAKRFSATPLLVPLGLFSLAYALFTLTAAHFLCFATFLVASGYLLRESETKERLYFKPTVFDFDFPQVVRITESKNEVRREKEERDFWFQYALYEPSRRSRLCIAFHCVALGADTTVPFWETRLEIEAATGIVIEQSFFTTRPEEAGYRTGVQSNYSTSPFTEVFFADPARADLYNTFIFQNIRALRDQPAGEWDYRKGFMTLFGMAADADGRPSVFYYANDPTVARLADGFGAGRAGLPFFDVLSHLLDIACSVEYLHAHSVIHGSISFETIVGTRA